MAKAEYTIHSKQVPELLDVISDELVQKGIPKTVYSVESEPVDHNTGVVRITVAPEFANAFLQMLVSVRLQKWRKKASEFRYIKDPPNMSRTTVSDGTRTREKLPSFTFKDEELEAFMRAWHRIQGHLTDAVTLQLTHTFAAHRYTAEVRTGNFVHVIAFIRTHAENGPLSAWKEP